MSRKEQLNILRRCVDDLSPDNPAAAILYASSQKHSYVDNSLHGFLEKNRDWEINADQILEAIENEGRFENGEWIICEPGVSIKSYSNSQLQQMIESQLDALLDYILRWGKDFFYPRAGMPDDRVRKVYRLILDLENTGNDS